MAKLKVLSRYGVIPNDILNSKDLSFKAKGLYAFIQSKPENWSFSAERISAQSNDGLSSVKTTLRELEQYGVLIRKRYQNEGGFWLVEYELLISPKVKNPAVEIPTKENPTTGKPTDISKQDSSKQEYSNKDTSKATPLQVSELIKLFEKVDKVNSTFYANKTQRKACESLLEFYGLDEVKKYVAVLEYTNKRPRYEFPFVNTPHLLLNNWKKLEDGIYLKQHQAENKYPVVN